MATTVTWTQDGNGNYEVSSAEHLKQIMHKGTLYTDAGSSPSSYWGSSTSYIQTADIDLLNDSADILPIGVDTDEFFGNYDGGEFSISNWSYLDANFTGIAQEEVYVGLFGEISDCVLKNIRLSGVWTLQGFDWCAGFLVGRSDDVVSGGATSLINIECNFAVGTFMDRGDVGGERIGGIIGRGRDITTLSGLTVKGSIDFRPNTHGTEHAGGICGYIDDLKGESTLLSNMATFPSGIHSTRSAGGIVGYFFTRGTTQPSRWINAMIGDISAGRNVGGVVGYAIFGSGGCDLFVNAMTGDINFIPESNSLNFAGGGVISYVQSLAYPMTRLFNYMNGDITRTGSGPEVGGIVGTVDDDPGSELNSCINAMNGTVENSIVGRQLLLNLVVTGVESNTNFGLTFPNADTYGTSSPSGLLTSSDFPDLPYAIIDGTDSLGNTYDFDFVYANLGGNSAYMDHTHAILHKGNICAPFDVEFDVAPAGSAIFTTFANIDTNTLSPAAGLTVTANIAGVTIVLPPPSLASDPGPVDIPVVITGVGGAVAYQVTYEGPAGGEIIAVAGTTTLEHSITGVQPDTTYTIRLYVDTGSGYELTDESTTTTLPNIATSYDKQDYEDGGFFNLRSLANSALSSLTSVWNGVFGTGDVVGVSVPTKSEFKGSFINLGDTLSIKEVSGVVLPFESTSGAGQDVSVTLSDDATTVDINYDDTVNSITVNGVVYYPGDSFILDGKKVTVLDV